MQPLQIVFQRGVWHTFSIVCRLSRTFDENLAKGRTILTTILFPLIVAHVATISSRLRFLSFPRLIYRHSRFRAYVLINGWENGPPDRFSIRRYSWERSLENSCQKAKRDLSRFKGAKLLKESRSS